MPFVSKASHGQGRRRFFTRGLPDFSPPPPPFPPRGVLQGESGEGTDSRYTVFGGNTWCWVLGPSSFGAWYHILWVWAGRDFCARKIYKGFNFKFMYDMIWMYVHTYIHYLLYSSDIYNYLFRCDLFSIFQFFFFNCDIYIYTKFLILYTVWSA